MNRPFSRFQPAQPQFRINGRIRAREVRVIGPDGQQVGVMDLAAAINVARNYGVDLVEIAPTATPPVCRVVDFGKFRYELSKKDRDSKKNQAVNLVKEIQLSARIDPHDLGIKLNHAAEFLCEDMKVKVALRFRGREMAHKEVGFDVINTFLTKVEPWGHPDGEPKLNGKTILVMLSPQAKNRRAKSPKLVEEEALAKAGARLAPKPSSPPAASSPAADATSKDPADGPRVVPVDAASQSTTLNSPFAGLDIPAGPPE